MSANDANDSLNHRIALTRKTIFTGKNRSRVRPGLCNNPHNGITYSWIHATHIWTELLGCCTLRAAHLVTALRGSKKIARSSLLSGLRINSTPKFFVSKAKVVWRNSESGTCWEMNRHRWYMSSCVTGNFCHLPRNFHHTQNHQADCCIFYWTFSKVFVRLARASASCVCMCDVWITHYWFILSSWMGSINNEIIKHFLLRVFLGLSMSPAVSAVNDRDYCFFTYIHPFKFHFFSCHQAS